MRRFVRFAGRLAVWMLAVALLMSKSVRELEK